MYVSLKKEEQLSPEELEKQYFNKLRFDSHKFIEIQKDIAVCAYCEKKINGYMGVNYSDIQLCHKNPHLFEPKFFDIMERILRK